MFFGHVLQPGSSSSHSPSVEQSPFGGVAAGDSEGWWNDNRRSQPNHMPSSAERDGSKVLSDEEVEELEAADAFPALGYPRTLASVGVGSFGSGACCKPAAANMPDSMSISQLSSSFIMRCMASCSFYC